MEYLAILTLSIGSEQVTASSNLTVSPGATRAEIFDHMRKSVGQANGNRWLQSATLFFSVEPNKLG